jgi:2,3-bisphosphoglycerate-independent phosphoglycerate mutase
MTRPLALIILDGWGIREDCTANAVCQARTPQLDALAATYPTTRLNASGLNVGLPDGQMGNSEVGHLNIGAGRIIYQDLTRISKSIADGDFFANPVLREAMARTKAAGGRLHLFGLLSDGGVHSHNTHVYALVEMARREGLSEVFIHAFTDGRDTPPKSAGGYIAELEAELARIGRGRIATVIGRYYAMDRDNRWERVEQAWRAMVLGEGEPADSGPAAIAAAYANGETDEFVKPQVVQENGAAIGTIRDGDGLIFFNFRADRAREITRSFTQSDFAGFSRPQIPALSAYACMSEYDETFALPVAFPTESYPDLLGTLVSRNGLKQLRIAETEKYAHVTFFFNGGEETPSPGEDRVLIPSPKEVATYDQKPEMSAVEVTDEVVRRIQGSEYALIVLNFANPDMVGHTGILPAAIKAMETVDVCVGRVVDALLAAGGRALITADHGNCEQMSDAGGTPHTAHTANLVPLILVDPERKDARLREGILADIAPTILVLLELPQPAAMTGKSLLMP